MQLVYATTTLLLLTLAGPVAAQKVYENVDEEGNPSFSDMPSEGAEIVDIEPANVANSVNVPEAKPAAAAPEKTSEGGMVRIVEDGMIRNPDDDDYRDEKGDILSKEEREERMEKRKAAQERHAAEQKAIERGDVAVEHEMNNEQVGEGKATHRVIRHHHK